MTTELRCPKRLHGKVMEGNKLEVKCTRRHCGAEPGVVVLHTFDLETGELLSTKRFADPKRKVEQHGPATSVAFRAP